MEKTQTVEEKIDAIEEAGRELETLSKGRVRVFVRDVCTGCNEIIEGSSTRRVERANDKMKAGEYHDKCFLKEYKKSFGKEYN